MDNDILNSSRRILVVDDDDSIRDLCALVLRTAGYQVQTARHGADGLEKLSGAIFDLVITDINMPELDGIEFYDSAVKETPSAAGSFLFMTGAATAEQMDLLAERRLRVMEKPFTINGFLGTIEEVMRERFMALADGQGGLRREGRLSFIDGCALVMSSQEIPATTLDISPNGIRASYGGEAIRAGAVVTIRVSVNGLSFERSGRAVWTEEMKEGFVSGIEFVRPMPVSSIINIRSCEMDDSMEALH